MRGLMRHIALFVVACAACGEASTVAPQANCPTAASAPVAQATAAPSDTSVGPICKVSGTNLGGGDDLELSTAPGRPPFAKVWQAERGEVTLPAADDVGKIPGVFQTDGLELHGFLEKDKLPIYPARPLVLRGFYALSPMRLRWTGAVAAGVALALPMPGGMHLVPPDSALREVVACADLSLARPSFDPYEPLQAKYDKPQYLEGKGVPLSTTPDGPAVATLDASPVIVLLIESRGTMSRIAWPPFAPEPLNSALFGWVPTSAIRAAPKDANIGHNEGGSYGRTGHSHHNRDARTLVCSHAVPLKVKLLAEVVEVGSVAAGRKIDLEADGTANPWPEKTGHELLNGASWVIDETAVADCALADAKH